MVSRVTGEDCAFIVQRLQRVAAFTQRIGAPPHTEEHASLQALKLFIGMIVSYKMLYYFLILATIEIH